MPEEFMPKNQLFCKDGSGFKTAIALDSFYEGEKVFYQIRVNSGNLCKIGVSRGGQDTNKAFSDTSDGYAYFDGQIRHSSNGSGGKYGTKLKGKDTVGICLDQAEGTLKFIINGYDFGEAFKADQLKAGLWYPAVAPIYQ